MTDAAGNPVNAPLDGQQTLRLRQVSLVPSDAALYENYLVFVPPINQCPASTLESAAQVTGPYAVEGTAVQDTGSLKFRAGVSPAETGTPSLSAARLVWTLP